MKSIKKTNRSINIDDYREGGPLKVRIGPGSPFHWQIMARDLLRPDQSKPSAYKNASNISRAQHNLRFNNGEAYKPLPTKELKVILGTSPEKQDIRDIVKISRGAKANTKVKAFSNKKATLKDLARRSLGARSQFRAGIGNRGLSPFDMRARRGRAAKGLHKQLGGPRNLYKPVRGAINQYREIYEEYDG